MTRTGRAGGLSGCGAWAWVARSLLHGRPIPGLDVRLSGGPLVLVRSGQDEAEDVLDAFRALAPVFGDEAAAPLGAIGASGTAEEVRAAAPPAFFGDDAVERLASLKRARDGSRLIVATAEAAAASLPSRDAFERSSVRFVRGARFQRSAAIEALLKAGYRRTEFVESPGEFAARGAVLDIFALEPLTAVRVLYDENTVESVRRFDPATRQTHGFLDEVTATLAHAGQVPEGSIPLPGGGLAHETAGGTLSDWAGPKALWIVEEGVDAGPAAVLTGSSGPGGFGAVPNGPYKGDPGRAWEEMRRLSQDGFKILLFSLNRGEDSRMQELLTDKLPRGACQFLIGPLRQGFVHQGLKLALFATAEIFERRYRLPSRWSYFAGGPRAPFRLARLKKGDFVVHRDYGVALYRGLESLETPGHGTTDCLTLEFRGGDLVYVAMTEFGRVQKFSGSEGKHPRLSSLNTRRWGEVTAAVQEGVKELAEQLLRIEAGRRAHPGHAFGAQTPMEREFGEAFPFEETQDQSTAIAEVLRDMEASHPMDRLVIGDVGFGKTEVAMRAAFRCVAGFKQAAVLVPTTILADQHSRTFMKRFADYPVKIGILTRFQTKAEQKAVLAALAKGTLDVVVGTARLLQKDVHFKDLGLVVADEEHRFGVKDKERLKSMRKSVDCLALSATPIPRSLHQALSGLRGISLIQSAPTGRLPIETRIAPWDPGRIASAVSEELARGGQVYYVHNRVRSLPQCVQRLEDMLPNVRFAMAHGRMTSGRLEDVMWRFFNKEFDVLVASSIIESGLDIPSVNTLLVENADDFGLAQIYQLRGRIGREARKAHCWLFLPEGLRKFSELSEEGRMRLEALQEFSQIGSGVKLAMRDMEIRGAGDILGKKQHGFLDSVGVEFYTQLLEDEVGRLRGAKKAPEPEVHIDFKVEAFIPEDYLPGEMERLEWYKRILRSSPAEWPGLRRELEDLCGPLPSPVRILFDLLGVRHQARQARLRSVVQRGRHIEVGFRPDAEVDPSAVSGWLDRYGGKALFFKGAEGDGMRVELGSESPLDWVRGFLGNLLQQPQGRVQK